MDHEIEVEVFRAGDYGPRGKWSEDDLNQIAADYAPEKHEAPVTLDHQQDGPAQGWVRALRRVGDKLVARLGGLAPEFLEKLKGGAYRKRSVEFYRNGPETDRPYLRALTFLGAGAPVVKGLADPVFSETDDAIAVAFSEDDTPPVEPETLTPDAQATAFCETLRNSGRVLPAWEQQGLAAFLSALDDETPRVFGEDDHPRTLRAWFNRFLENLPPAIPMGEAAPSEPAQRADAFSDTRPCSRFDEQSITLHERVCNLRATHPEVSYAEALRQVVNA